MAAAAAAVQIPRQQLHDIVAKRGGVSTEMAISFEKACGTTGGTWLRMQVNDDLAAARRQASWMVIERLAPKGAQWR